MNLTYNVSEYLGTLVGNLTSDHFIWTSDMNVSDSEASGAAAVSETQTADHPALIQTGQKPPRQLSDYIH